MINHEDLDDSMRRRKRIPINQQFIQYIFENPENIWAKEGLPDDAVLINFYHKNSKNMWYIEFCSEKWDIVEEGEKVPEYNLEILQKYCEVCGNEMVYNDRRKFMYCPRCETHVETELG